MKVTIEVFKVSGKWEQTLEYVSDIPIYESKQIEDEIRGKFFITTHFTFRAESVDGINFRLCES